MDINQYSQTGNFFIAMATSLMAEVEGVLPGAEVEGVLKRRGLEGRRKIK